MVPRTIPPLVWCSLWAVPTALLTTLYLPAGAWCAAAGVLFACWSRRTARFAGLTALPVCLAALPLLPRTVLQPPPGPVAVDGVVMSTSRVPATGAVHVWLGDGRARLRVVFDTELEVLPGDRLAVLGAATAPAAPGLPGSLHGIAATARVTPGPWSFWRAAAAARRALEVQLANAIPGPDGAMLGALVLGRGTRPDAELMAAHRATGLSHLLAVSGAHAAMLAFLLGLSGRRRGRRLAGGPVRTCCLLLLLFVYAAITGGEPPVLRAVVAFATGALATYAGRPCGIATGLLAPGVLTCLLQPDALLGPSFLLSYAAVAGLALAGAGERELDRARGGETFAARWLWAPLRASAWATLMTMPLTLWFFGQLAPWTVLLTPLLAPVVGALLLGGLATAMLGCVLPAAAPWIAWPVAALARVYATAVEAADRLPATPIHALCTPAGWAMALGALAAVVAITVRPARGSFVFAAIALALPHFVPLAPSAADRVVLFAIGHGQAALVLAGDHAAAIDCGSLQQPFVAAERIATGLPVRRLDLLVITHGDHDHHNGVPALLERVHVAHALLPAQLAGTELASALARHGATVALLAPGERARPAAHVDVWAPALPASAGDNDQSLWVHVRVGDVTVLATGDAEELGVAVAIAAGVATPHDVLVLPHHGRPNTHAPELLRAVRPRVCLASAAAADGDTALGALARSYGADLWVTGVHGTLTVTGAPPRVDGAAGGRPFAARPP